MYSCDSLQVILPVEVYSPHYLQILMSLTNAQHLRQRNEVVTIPAPLHAEILNWITTQKISTLSFCYRQETRETVFSPILSQNPY